MHRQQEQDNEDENQVNEVHAMQNQNSSDDFFRVGKDIENVIPNVEVDSDQSLL